MIEELIYHYGELDEQMLEIISLFDSLPQNDPDKENIYKDIITMLEYERDRKSESKPRIRLLNDEAPGQISLKNLGNSSTNVQNIFSSAYNKVANIQSSRSRFARMVQDQSEIFATLKAGSFIIEIERIGNPVEEDNSQLLAITDSIDSYELIDNIMVSISNLENDEALFTYIENYGIKSLGYVKEWFENLYLEDTEFEYIHKNDNIFKKFDNRRIVEITSLIDSLPEYEEEEAYLLHGTLVGLSNETQKLTFRTIENDRITVQVLDDSMRTNNLVSNEVYEFETKKITKRKANRESVSYIVETIDGIVN